MQSLQDMCMSLIVNNVHKPPEFFERLELTELPRSHVLLQYVHTDPITSIDHLCLEVINRLAEDVSALEQLPLPPMLKEKMIILRKEKNIQFLINDIHWPVRVMAIGIDVKIEQALARAFERRAILDDAHFILQAQEFFCNDEHSVQIGLAPDGHLLVQFQFCDLFYTSDNFHLSNGIYEITFDICHRDTVNFYEDLTRLRNYATI